MTPATKMLVSLNTNTDELQAVSVAQPKAILISFARWGNKNIQQDLINFIGYRPELIMVDSGAFTFKEPSGVGKIQLNMEFDQYGLDLSNEETGEFDEVEEDYDVALEMYGDQSSKFQKYMDWLDENRENIDYIISMDAIGDPEESLFAFKAMSGLGYTTIPVFHKGSDERFLEAYIAAGAKYIGLGGSAVRKDNKKAANYKERIAWAQPLVGKYPGVNFHMLGTMDKRILKAIPSLHSVDGTSWITKARYQAEERGLNRLSCAIGVLKELERQNYMANLKQLMVA